MCLFLFKSNKWREYNEKKNEIYNEKLTSSEKSKIFDEIFADKRTNGKVTELLNDAEKSAVFDALLATKTNKEFIVGKSSNTDRSNKTFVGNLTDEKSYIFYVKSVDTNFNVSEAKESAT